MKAPPDRAVRIESRPAPQLGQIDFAHVAELTPEVFIEEYHWWQV